MCTFVLDLLLWRAALRSSDDPIMTVSTFGCCDVSGQQVERRDAGAVTVQQRAAAAAATAGHSVEGDRHPVTRLTTTVPRRQRRVHRISGKTHASSCVSQYLVFLRQ